MSTQSLQIFNNKTLKNNIESKVLLEAKDELFYKHLLLGKKPDKYKKTFNYLYYDLVNRFNCENLTFLKEKLQKALDDKTEENKKEKFKFELIQAKDFVQICENISSNNIVVATECVDYWNKTEW